MFNRTSVDGYFTGPADEIDWFIHDPEVDIEAHKLMNPDTIILGRKTYQMFEGFWPAVAADPNAPEHMRNIANELNEMTKIVCTQTLNSLTWINSVLLKGDITEAVNKIKNDNGNDIVIFGSGSIVKQLSKKNLIDEYIIVISPHILGGGKSFFEGLQRIDLKLMNSRTFVTNHMLLHYKRNR